MSCQLGADGDWVPPDFWIQGKRDDKARFISFAFNN